MQGDDFLDEFLEYDVGMGGNIVKCPHCGADVPYSLFFDNEVECPECRKEIQKR